MKKKILISSIAVIALCLCLIAGSTFALFTETANVNISVTAGDLDITATVHEDSIEMRSLGDAVGTFPRNKDDNTAADMQVFENGGTVSFSNSVLTISDMTPGDAVRFDISVENGEMAVKYKFGWATEGAASGQANLLDALTFTVYDANGNQIQNPDTNYQDLAANTTVEFTVVVEFADDNGADTNNNGITDNNEFKGAEANINFMVEAIQPNGAN